MYSFQQSTELVKMLSTIVKEHQNKQAMRKEKQGKTKIVRFYDKDNYYIY